MKVELTSDQLHFIADIDDILVVVGSNRMIKDQLFYHMRKMKVTSCYTDEETKFYGVAGIQFKIDDKKINASKQRIYTINGRQDIEGLFTLDKKGLIFNELLREVEDIDLVRQLDRVNDQLMRVEQGINQKLDTALYNLELKTFEWPTLFGKFAELKFSDAAGYVSLDSQTSGQLLNQWLISVEKFVKDQGQAIWLVIRYPETYLEINDYLSFIEKVRVIAQETKLLKIIVIHYRQLENNIYSSEFIDKTVLAMNRFEQLPELEYFRDNVQKYYPDEMTDTDNMLTQRFYRISHIIGETEIYKNSTIFTKDMILLKVLGDIVEMPVTFETSDETLSALETAFLLE
ncbi:CRISPR-associated protein Csn2-St [Dolosigranulum pigrum]|uniref:CRISPR-associated protein Csn2-St n=1 Tax=Dolosigranulum pigrum TaxID=29394 RepID=UPI000DBFF624|nr:CRISPR-associated protein Csn2-St [Dolosigranulum pigrum]RAN66155.1 hypothetical protein B8A45_00525 [Dolosigranulum pigrum]